MTIGSDDSRVMVLILKVSRELGPETKTKECWDFIVKAVDDKLALMQQEPPEEEKD